jgi:branched-chain amino acid transport system ATP-binding protein
LESPTGTLLSIREISIAFGGIRAVDGVDMDVRSASLQGIVGPNGSGKSTLLALISRLISPDHGEIVFSGQNCSKSSASAIAHLGLARTFQTVRLQPSLTVLENVMLGADPVVAPGPALRTWLDPWASRSADRKSKAAAEGAIDRLRLGAFAHRYPSTLTYGTLRRVEIARAIASRPRLLLLDEPTAGMNRDERQEIGALLAQLQSEGLTQILVEHDVGMITELCDSLVVLNFGKVIAQGAPEECVQLPEVQEAYMGKAH